MLSLNNNKLATSLSSQMTQLALITSLGLVLFLFESLIPTPLPWLKPGLAHVATLVALYILGIRSAFIVVVLRILVGSMMLGTLFNPAFLLSFCGGIAATLSMVLLKQFLSVYFSIFGISICGAVVHNLTQLILVERVIVKRLEIFYLIPVMIISGVVTGFIVAVLSYLLISKIIKINFKVKT